MDAKKIRAGAVTRCREKNILIPTLAQQKDPTLVPKAVLVIPPKKKAISIRVDEDVLDYFKKQGAGYQRRMNPVLRSYMQQKRKKRA